MMPMIPSYIILYLSKRKFSDLHDRKFLSDVNDVFLHHNLRDRKSNFNNLHVKCK